MCGCITEMNKALAPHNGRVAETLNLCTGHGYAKIEVEKVAPRGRKPPLAIPTFCPFCGEKYPNEER